MPGRQILVSFPKQTNGRSRNVGMVNISCVMQCTFLLPASKKQFGMPMGGGGCGGGCPQQCAPACQQSCCGGQPQGQMITHLTTVHHHHVHHMAPAPPAPPTPPMPPPPPPQTFHTQQHLFECAQPPCPPPMPMPPAAGGCAQPACGGGMMPPPMMPPMMPPQPCGAPPCGK